MAPARRLGRAALYALGTVGTLTVAACSSGSTSQSDAGHDASDDANNIQPAYGGPPDTDGGMVDAAYGGPPIDASDDGSIAPMYGLPPPDSGSD